ncbi:putative non-hem dioxygenase domain, isopenicillin N synthase [Helianthus anomalus]
MEFHAANQLLKYLNPFYLSSLKAKNKYNIRRASNLHRSLSRFRHRTSLKTSSPAADPKFISKVNHFKPLNWSTTLIITIQILQMTNLVSTWSKTTQILPENYIFPVDQRPGSVKIPLCQNIPLIDLSASQSQTVEEILHACQEFGFFQVINHGVSKDLIDETMEVVKEFFNMPEEEKEIYYSIDPIKSCKLYTSG